MSAITVGLEPRLAPPSTMTVPTVDGDVDGVAPANRLAGGRVSTTSGPRTRAPGTTWIGQDRQSCVGVLLQTEAIRPCLSGSAANASSVGREHGERGLRLQGLHTRPAGFRTAATRVFERTGRKRRCRTMSAAWGEVASGRPPPRGRARGGPGGPVPPWQACERGSSCPSMRNGQWVSGKIPAGGAAFAREGEGRGGGRRAPAPRAVDHDLHSREIPIEGQAMESRQATFFFLVAGSLIRSSTTARNHRKQFVHT